ncbi:hypothetical protein CDAR_419531 [Caerostris darwini]|uniref:Uncharacterized protein n=1 Tax=Caerostris darwini TaxID=1538125 RepID=A0AAV4PWF9_9ARAC|nr:hypothetical protein CDAR_419531 [Caerostris darwini]
MVMTYRCRRKKEEEKTEIWRQLVCCCSSSKLNHNCSWSGFKSDTFASATRLNPGASGNRCSLNLDRSEGWKSTVGEEHPPGFMPTSAGEG